VEELGVQAETLGPGAVPRTTLPRRQP
jgi:hypothetical protein